MKGRSDWRPAAAVAVLYVVATVLFVRMHAELRVSRGILVYILLIVAAAAVSGRAFAYIMVAASYAAVDWLFVAPIGNFGTPATDRKSTRLNSSHVSESRMPSSA